MHIHEHRLYPVQSETIRVISRFRKIQPKELKKREKSEFITRTTTTKTTKTTTTTTSHTWGQFHQASVAWHRCTGSHSFLSTVILHQSDSPAKLPPSLPLHTTRNYAQLLCLKLWAVQKKVPYLQAAQK